MEAEGPAEKGTRRKLKRIVKKAAKVRNASASVVYYKKVKAALNASLNSSRVRQTLQTNNKALAQSLQQAKQEIRNLLNENAHLRLEIQDLNIKLLRLENQGRPSAEQSNLEQRLHSLMVLLNQMSSHLLEVGTCINNGVDLCLVTPHTSQASTSRSAFLEQFGDENQKEKLTTGSDGLGVSNSSSDGLDTSLALADVPMEIGAFPEHGDIRPVPLSLAAPDMSVIMEQSIMVDEGEQHVHHAMNPVLEEPAIQSSKIASAGTVKKPSGISKLPQRVRKVASSTLSSEDENDTSGNYKSDQPARRAEGSSGDASGKSSVDSTRRGTFTLAHASASWQDTFMVIKTALMLGGEDIEGIDSVEMPELVTGLSTSEEECSPKACKTVPEDPPKGATCKSPHGSPKEPVQDAVKAKTTAAESKEQDAVTSKLNSSTKKEPVKKSTKATPAFKTLAPVYASSKTGKTDEPGFFISNPCALNLVHQRNTGSNDGCIEAGAKEPPKNAASVDQFLKFKDSNSRSRQMGSLSPALKTVQKNSEKSVASKPADKSTGKPMEGALQQGAADEGKPMEPMEGALQQGAADEGSPDNGDQTVYFNSDMDFTKILSPTQTLETMHEEPSAKSRPQNSKENPAAEESGNEKQSKDAIGKEEAMKRAQSKSRSKSVRSKGARFKDTEGNESDSDSGQILVGEDKKLAVAMRVGKPGEMKFAAARKEEDGSRKAIPAKPLTKARSKSKKLTEEMLKNLQQEEPKSIFDFHDRTPKHAEDKSKAPTSVFDISLDESLAVPSLATLREKLAVFTKELQHRDASQKASSPGNSKKSAAANGTKPAAQSLLGDAPEYCLPLKGDDSDNQPEPKSHSRGRSASRGRASQSRSKSRSRKTEEEENADPGAKHARSKSKSRSKKKAEGEDHDAELQHEKLCGRKRRESATDADTEEEHAKEESTGLPRRSGRSKSGVRKVYALADSNESIDEGEATPVKSESEGGGRGRSRSRHKREDDDDRDDDYRPSKGKSGAVRSQQRGRSRHRKGDAVAVEKDSDGGKAESASSAAMGISDEQDKVQKDSERQEESERLASSEGSVSDRDSRCSQSRARKSKGKPEKTLGSTDEALTVPATSVFMDPSSKVTQRKHWSKSAQRKLYHESENFDDVFEFLPELQPDVQPVSELAGAVGSEAGQSECVKSRCRGEVLHSTDKKDDNVHSSDSSQGEYRDLPPAEHKHGDSEMTSNVPSRTADSGMPSEKIIDSATGKECSVKQKSSTDSSQQEKPPHRDSESEFEEARDRRHSCKKRSLSRSGVSSTDSSPLPVKKGKTSSQAKDHNSIEGEGKPFTSNKARGKKKDSKVVAEPLPVSSDTDGEKDIYQLQFEVVKRKLHQLGDNFHKEKDQDVQQPLVLPPAPKNPISSKSLISVAADLCESKEKSRKSKKGSKSQPGSPHAKKGSTAPSLAASSPTPSSARSSLQLSEDCDESSQAEGRRARRAAASVSYKEPSLHTKLRRGDPFTTFLYKNDQLHIYKGNRQCVKSNKVDREVFSDLTNQSIAEVEDE